MFERLQRSWDLALQCLEVLRNDKSLLLLPLFSGIALVLIVGTFAVPLMPLAMALSPKSGRPPDHMLLYILLFMFYFVQFSVMNFFNTALVEVAMQGFDGKEATVRDGLQRAWSRLPEILLYSVIAATVGTLLRAIEERVGFIGRIVVGLIGFVWAVATALVVPVLAAEDVGPFEAINRSAELIKKAWGEQIIGNVGIGLVFGLAAGILVGVVGGALASDELIQWPRESRVRASFPAHARRVPHRPGAHDAERHLCRGAVPLRRWRRRHRRAGCGSAG